MNEKMYQQVKKLAKERIATVCGLEDGVIYIDTLTFNGPIVDVSFTIMDVIDGSDYKGRILISLI